MVYRQTDEGEEEMKEWLGIAAIVMFVIAWFNHIFTCFAEGWWGFLIAGALFFPIGVIHGMWLWFQ